MTLGPPVPCQRRSGLDRRVRHPVLAIAGPDRPASAHLRDQCSPRQALVAPVGARQIPIAPADPGAPIPLLPSLAAFERRPGRARGCVRAGPASETRHSCRLHDLTLTELTVRQLVSSIADSRRQAASAEVDEHATSRRLADFVKSKDSPTVASPTFFGLIELTVEISIQIEARL
jgi:hypothetical protein